MLQQKGIDYNWYHTSVTFDSDVAENGLRWARFVTFAANLPHARLLAVEHAKTLMREGERFYQLSDPISLYQKNYIRESRALVAAGKFAGIKPEGV